MKAFVLFVAKYIVGFFCWLVFILPLRVQLFLGACIGFLWFDLFRIRRNIIFENLERAFPEKSLADKTRIGRRSCWNMGQGLIEFCRFPFIRASDIEQFELHGKEHLEEALKKEKGVCFLTLHLGNGDMATVGLALHGIKIHLISKEFTIRWLNDVWFDLRRKWGVKFIAPRNSSYAVLKALKKNEIVAFVLDQFMGPPIGVKTTFFGHETGTAMGLAVLAQRSKAPVLPIYTYRKPSGVTVVVIEKEVPFVEQESKESTIQSMTQVYNDVLEDKVRAHPEQWMWVHRRWKKFRDQRKSSQSEP